MTHSNRPRRTLLAGLLATLLIAGCGSKTAQNSSQAPAGSQTTSTGSNGGAAPESTAAIATPTTPSLELGEKVFKQRCVLCHGPGGHGDGAAAAALKPHPRNFHDTEYMKSRTDDQLLVTIHNGKGPMPAWKTILTEVEMRSALLY